MTLHDELNSIGYEMAQRRLRAAEGFTRNALAMTPYTGETAAEFAKRMRFWAERNHPELIVRLEDHQRQEILPLADTCGCDPNSDGYDDDHCESGEDGEDLCARQHLGFVCASCVNETGNGPSWRPDRYEWPCPTTRVLDEAPAADRAAVLQEAADIAEGLRQFEPAFGARKSAQVSENVGILRVVDELRRIAAVSGGEQ